MHGSVSELMRTLASSKKGSSVAMATLLMVIVTLIGGIFLYNYVMGSVLSMTNNLSTQMSILLDSVYVNSTHIRAWIRNTGSSAVNIVNAYVNNQIGLLVNEVKVAASSVALALISGTYSRGSTYTVKLAGIFGILMTFEVQYQ